MKQILLIALCFSINSAFSQGKTLMEVSMVKPKIGQSSAFENSWKAHVAKFHGKDNARWVYEILTGNNTGAYLLMEGPQSFADMDKQRGDQSAHDMDYEKNVAPKNEMEGGNFIYSWRDSLSYNNTMEADKYLVTLTRVKNSRMGDYMQEARRAVQVNTKRKLPFGLNTYVQMFSGSNPVHITVRTLKDGYKELEENYSNIAPTAFRDAYLKDYSQEQWDKRIKLGEDAIVDREIYIMKFRKDLSTK